jgi:hypothetical protein
MKTNFVKTTFTSFLLILAFGIPSITANAQVINQGSIEQDNQPIAQHNQFDKQHKQQGDQRKNIEAQRIAFITQELNLTPDEAKVFWPVYNEYEAKRHDLRKSFRDAENMHKDDIDKLTEKEATQLLDNQIIEAQKFLDLRKEYHTKFKAVLPAVKVLKLYDAERDFQKMLIDKLRQNKSNPPMDKDKK